jgi:hypothetical protein
VGSRWMWRDPREERGGPCRPSDAVSLALIGEGAAGRIEIGVGFGFSGCEARGGNEMFWAKFWFRTG